MNNARNPMQPLVKVGDVVRFRANAIVCHLLDHGGIDLNRLAFMRDQFSQDDWEQFAQLIGYSLCGYHELSYVSDESALAASAKAREQWPESGGCRDGDGCEIHSGVDRRGEP